MADRYLVPWTGAAYRHMPADAGRDALDFDLVGQATDNRWNDQGQPTLYLAGDPGILIAEWGRHLPTVFDSDLMEVTVQRSVFRLRMQLDAVIDLRRPGIGSDLGLERWPQAMTDRSIARYAAARIRNETPAQAIPVPSIAFLDDLARWNLVVFLDKLLDDTTIWNQHTEYIGPLRWR